MDLTMQLNEIVNTLDDRGKLLLIRIAEKYLQADDWDDDELSEEDLYWIAVAEQEYANGETVRRR